MRYCIAQLGAQITKLGATRQKWRACQLNLASMSSWALDSLALACAGSLTSNSPSAFLDTLRDHWAAAQGPQQMDMEKLSTADLEALVAIGENYSL